MKICTIVDVNVSTAIYMRPPVDVQDVHIQNENWQINLNLD